MRDKIMTMPVRDVLGMKIKFIYRYTGFQRTGKVLSISAKGLMVDSHRRKELVEWDEIVEVCDAENKG